MLGLIWIHTVRLSDCIPDFFFRKGDFEKKWQATKKHENYSVGKELKRFFFSFSQRENSWKSMVPFHQDMMHHLRLSMIMIPSFLDES